MLDTEFAVPTLFKLLPLVFTVSLSILAIIFSEFIPKVLISFKLSRLGYNIFGFFNQRFLIELFYNKYITGLVLKLGGQTTKILDKGSVELLGPFGLEKGLITLSRNIASLDKGVITSYALYILIGLIFYMLIPYLALTDNSLLLLILIALLSVITTNLKDNSSDTIVSVGESKHENTISPLESKLFFDFFKSISYYIHSSSYVRDYTTKSINDTPEGIKDEVNNFSEEANVKPFNVFNTQDLNYLNEHTSLKMDVGLPKADLIQLRAGDLFVVLSSLDKFKSDKHSSIVSKIFFVKYNHKFSIDDMRSNLYVLGVKLTYVFYIGDFEQKSNTLNPTSSAYEDELVVFMHFKYAEWLPFVNSNHYNFIKNNNHCLYIIKNGTFTDVKKLFQYLN
jgi:hypothetical protein